MDLEQAASTKELKITAIREQFIDEWVVVEVTKNDRYSVPVAGKVIVHGKNKIPVYDDGFRMLRQNPDKDLFFFFTGEPVPDDVGIVL